MSDESGPGTPKHRRRPRHTRRSGETSNLQVESLESRTMLSGASAAPHRTGATLLHESSRVPSSRNPAIFTSLMGLLQARATAGPLAALAGGKVGGSAFVAKLSNLISAFDRGAARF
jgi:hypothetical protein